MTPWAITAARPLRDTAARSRELNRNSSRSDAAG